MDADERLRLNLKNAQAVANGQVSGLPCPTCRQAAVEVFFTELARAGRAVKECEKGAQETAVLYQKVGAKGEHLKFGIAKDPATRYSKEELAGGRLRVLAEGPKEDMLKLERDLHETLPISPEEGQKFYIQKQIEKGLKPPPY